MTSTTIIDTRVQSRPLVVPRGLPPLKTFVGQAVAGALFSHFVMFVVACVAAGSESLGFWLFALPCLLLLSLFGGVPAGFIIWACTRSDARPLHWAHRCVIALLVLLPGWLYLSSIAFSATASVQLWMLACLLLPAVMIGLFTHSRLRVGRALVRGGEAVGRGSRVLAGISGVVLRLTVVLLFMESVVGVSRLLHQPTTNNDLIWTVLVCGHFTASLFVVFLRNDIDLLAVCAAIAIAPLIIALVTFREISEPLRYVAGGYFALWFVFLLTRWRQTDYALAFLNEEIHYYLID